MTELELMQQAGWGEFSEPETQRIAVALAAFMRALNYHDAAKLCDVIANRSDYVDDAEF